MRLSEERYISLLTDFGFKRIFGTKPNKDLLINFLNSLFDGEQVIKDVRYLNSEHVGDVFAERKAIFDVYCENEKGEKFIVEMQNAFQKYFKDRSLFYSTFPIREQAPKGQDWNFKLAHVYTVALLNFDFKEEAFDQKEINHDVGLLDKKTFKVFNDKLSFKYIEIAKFNKSETELETLYDKWLYVLKNLPKLDKRPKALKERIFTKLFEEAEIAKFSQQELREYEDRNSPVVRPPVLGGNEKVGVFATRSPFRPNNIGLSSVKISRIEWETSKGPVIHVKGGDLMDGTPIYDIKPYVVYADCHPDARSGFVDDRKWAKLDVEISGEVREYLICQGLNDEKIEILKEVLAQDPRPHYQKDPHKVYGMPYEGLDIHFSVSEKTLTVVR